MAREIGIIFVLLLQVILGLTEDRTQVVNTTIGPVQGIVKKTIWNSVEYLAFLGIPYAESPIEDLRFKPPVPKKPWTEVFQATKDSQPCPQIDFFTGNYMGIEDCLTLNVYSPKVGNSTKKLPVMVWIYGGAYIAGYDTSTMYGPDFFLEQNVVVVSLSYRVGLAGFLNLEHPDATGNQALKDQNLVLHWVQDNIANFGGDPNRVTIFGESAGSSSVGFHILSEKSNGLFTQAIYQSGTPLCQWSIQSPKKAYANAEELAKRLGYSGDTTEELLEFLRHADIERLVKETSKVDYGILPFRPTVEKADISKDNSSFLTQCPIKLYQSGRYNKVPTLSGWNKDEMLFFLNYMVGNGSHIEGISNLLSATSDITGPVKDMLTMLSAYSVNMLPDFVLRMAIAFFSDLFFIAPIDLTHKLMSATNEGQPLYCYRLSYESAYTMHEIVGVTINGTAHVDDVGYLFHVEMLNAPTDPEHVLNVFRKKFVTLWANFATYGNPTPPGAPNTAFGVTWEKCNPTGVQLDINTTSIMKPRMVDELAESYEAVLLSMLPTETGCV